MFKEILDRIVNEGHAVGAVLMGFDGIAVEQVLCEQDDVDTHLIAVEYATVLKEVKHAAKILDSGDVEEVAINTGRYYVVLRLLTDDYFVALTLLSDGNIGKAKYLLLRESFALKQELV